MYDIDETKRLHELIINDDCSKFIKKSYYTNLRRCGLWEHVEIVLSLN